MAIRAAKVTEKSFTGAVIAYATLHGWRTAHFRPGLTQAGKWRTAVQGQGAGFPDLLLLRGERQVVAELKVGRNKPTEEQILWLAAFRAAGVPAYLWTPDEWGEIEAALGANP